MPFEKEIDGPEVAFKLRMPAQLLTGCLDPHATDHPTIEEADSDTVSSQRFVDRGIFPHDRAMKTITGSISIGRKNGYPDGVTPRLARLPAP